MTADENTIIENEDGTLSAELSDGTTRPATADEIATFEKNNPDYVAPTSEAAAPNDADDLEATDPITQVIVQYIDPNTGLTREVIVLTGYTAADGDDDNVKRIRSMSATSENEAYNYGVAHARDNGLLHESMDTAGTQNIASSEASGEAAIPAVIAEGDGIADRPNYKTANTQADASPEVQPIDLSHDRDDELAPEDRREVIDPAAVPAIGDPLPGDEHSLTLQPNTQTGVVGGEGEAGSEATQLGTAGTQNAISPEATAAPSQESAAASASAVGDLGAAADSEQASHDEGVAVNNDSEKAAAPTAADDAADAQAREDAKDRPAADKTDAGKSAIDTTSA